MFLGTKLTQGTIQLASPKKSLSGKVHKAVNHKDEAYYVLEGELPADCDWTGHTLIVEGDDGFKRPYQLLKCAVVDGEFRAYPRVSGVGLPVHETKTWTMPNVQAISF